MERPPLTRSRDDRVVAGVCAGLARHLGLSATVVRIGAVALALVGGAGALLYLWLWVTVPREGEADGIVPLRAALTKPVAGGLPASLAKNAAPPQAERAAGSRRAAAAVGGAPQVSPGAASTSTAAH
ncbi:MAG: PspC domain-containing protein [Leucobacter sp.]